MRYARFGPLVLFAFLLTGCDSGRTHVIVGTIVPPPPPVFTNAVVSAINPFLAAAEPSTSFWASRDDPEWSREKERVESSSARNWKATYSSYGQALVARAVERQLDSVSLSNVLKWILADGETQKMAYLPFAAYHTEVNGEPVWVVDLTWEYESFGHFGHIRTYAISARNLSQVGFTTCR